MTAHVKPQPGGLVPIIDAKLSRELPPQENRPLGATQTPVFINQKAYKAFFGLNSVRRRSSFADVAEFLAENSPGGLREPRGKDQNASRWCSGLAYEPVTLMTRVRIPTGTPSFSPIDNIRDVVLPSSCLFRLSEAGPVAQHGRASGFYPGAVSAAQERNQAVVGPNPTRPATSSIISTAAKKPAGAGRAASFSLHFRAKRVSEELI